MATRFYLPSDGTPAITPAFDASWEATGAPTRRPLEISKAVVTAMTSVAVAEAVNNTAYDVAVAQFISAPLDGNQTISGAIKGIIRASESNAAADMRAQLVIRVLSGDGSTVRGTLLASDGSALASEFPTAIANRKFPLAWAGSGTTPTTVNALDGDRIVVEVGFRSHEASATSRTGTLRFGTDSGSDLAENETGTDDFAPWIEFADNLVFDAAPLRVTQNPAIVATRPVPDLRVTQQALIVAIGETVDLRVTQTVLLVAVENNPPPAASATRAWTYVID